MPTPAVRRISPFALLLIPFVTPAVHLFAQQTPVFTPGNLVVAVEGCGNQNGTCTPVNGNGTATLNSTSGGYGDNQAAPFSLFQFAPSGTASATYVNTLVLPQTASGANLPVSGEYGSSSEGALHLSTQGQYITLGTYGINPDVFNAAPTTYGAAPSNALAQSGSLTGQSYTPVARVITLVDAYGNTNSSTALFNIYNTNNPRGVYTQNGQTAYISGQSTGADAYGGVFLTPLFKTNTAPTAITGLDTATSSTNTTPASQDTRDLQIVNGTLYVSVDSRQGSGSNRSFIGTLGAPPATSLYNNNAGPTQLPFSNNASTPVQVTSTGKLVLTASETNGLNATGQTINLSASGFFFANASTLYIADTGEGKQTSASTTLGDGGLQKWVNTKADGTGTWQLMYTLSAGLGLIANMTNTPANTSGTTGLYAVTGIVSGANVLLYATNSTINDLDATYLYGFTDVLAATTKPATSFTRLATAPQDSNFKGVTFAPTLPAGSATLTSVPSGLTITTNGTGCAPGTYVTPVTLVWTPGTTCQLITTSPQSSNGTAYVFNKWQDATTSTTDVVNAPNTSAVYTATFTMNYQPVGALEKVQDNTTGSSTVQQGDSLLVSGYAADPVDGSPLANIKVYVDGNLFGTPTTGITRNDVATAYNNPAYIKSGYQLIMSAQGLAVGAHSVTVIAIDSNNKSTTFGPVTINVVASAGEFAGLAVNGAVSETQPGVAQSIVVTAVDSNGTQVTGFTGTVTLTSTDPQATLPASYTFTAADAGSHTFPITLNTGGTLSVTATSAAVMGTQSGIVIGDAVWFLNATDSLVRLTDAGVQTTVVGSGGTSSAGALAFDNAGNVWATQQDKNGFVEYSATGATLASGAGIGGLNAPSALALDGAGQVWIANQGNKSVTVLSPAAAAVSPANGYQPGALSTPTGVAIDSAGSVWITNSGANTITRIIGAAAPVATPTVTGTTNNTLAVRP